ncbi:hypothetical protein BV25DRAFT_1352121 [Artomyces pyxidatus]|uniref:Uncharacterized protein n=1 Tax=Artomyces pyxidatus TaxID=48021 RepID=A0ACB8SMN3_9AGAM|nr:hypothetical protein BV25DRAFT_1352121 [Artomyces pyxidatus]
MYRWLALLLFTLPTYARPQTHGVAPALLPRYSPSAQKTWTCLDGSKDIPWASVNDDYCDCADGSDEPGTSACPNTSFYCVNEGHIGSTISSTRVNDGLCEKECCDGSDEPAGVCANTCKEVGESYRKEYEAARKLRKTGSKIRSTYIAFAQKEKKRLEAAIEASEKEIAEQEKEVARLKDIADRTEALSAEELEIKKQSPLYTSLLTHSAALKSLQREHKKHLEREKALGEILDTMRSNYNPNYQDMAVLEAVRGWEYHAGLPHIGEAEREEGVDEDDDAAKEDAAEEVPEGEWTAEELEHQLDTLLETDYVSLLMEHDKHVGPAESAAETLLYDVPAYLPDAFIPQYEAFRDSLVSWLAKLGIIRDPASRDAGDASKAREAYNAADHSLDLAKKELEKANEELSNLFDPTGYGADGEWKKLDGLCLTKDTGDYTYEVCLFGEAKQKPNHGGSTFSLGKFTSWHPSHDVAPGSPEYYSQQAYTQGTKCWNGPHRSVKLHLSCGTDNALLGIAELEKCEYLFTGTSPALCLPLEDEGKTKDEL